MQVNTFSNIASMARTQVSNKKADDAVGGKIKCNHRKIK